MTRRIFCKVLLVVVAILGLLALSNVLLAQGNSENAFEHVREVQERNTERLMAMNGVEGTAIGINENDQLAVKVFTAGPGVRGIPQELEGVPVQVVVTGKIYALADPTVWFPRPVPTGVSTGHPAITAGTIGCRVTDGTNVYALSNNHVYADENNASIGDNVLQPGPSDGGEDSDDAIGTLYDFEQIVFHPRARNTIDAAIALTSTDMVGNATPSGGYGAPSSTTATAYVGMAVKKYGRTTGLTEGEVYALNATVRVGYSSGTARFVGQIIITPGGFSDGGDSGSLIVTQSGNNPVGLLFAGSSTVTIANPIDAVLTRFGVSVDDGSPSIDSPPSVGITNPIDGATISGTVTVTAEASDDVGVTQVEFFVDGGSIGTDTSAPYETSWDSTTVLDGSHTIKAIATDTVGQTASDSISVMVSNDGGGSGTMHVSVIDMWYSTAGPNYFVYTQVTVVDESGNPVSDATVELTTTLPDDSTGSGSGTTGSDGIVTFKLRSRQTGSYTSEVTNLTHASFTYDSGANVETSENLSIP